MKKKDHKTVPCAAQCTVKAAAPQPELPGSLMTMSGPSTCTDSPSTNGRNGVKSTGEQIDEGILRICALGKKTARGPAKAPPDTDNRGLAYSFNLVYLIGAFQYPARH